MDKFNLTEKRKAKLIKLFESGYSISAAALALECSNTTLHKLLKEHSIDAKQLHQARLYQFQKDLFLTIETELQPDDRVKHGLKYLERYQKDLEIDEPTTKAVDITVNIAADIMKELSSE